MRAYLSFTWPTAFGRALSSGPALWPARFALLVGLSCALAPLGCATEGADASGTTGRTDGDASSHARSDASADAALARAPLAIMPPAPGDTPLEEADQAHVVELAPLSDGGVAAIVTRRDGFGSFALGGGALFNGAALMVFDVAGALRWQRSLSPGGVHGVTRLLALPDMGLLAADGTRLRQFSPDGVEVRSAPIEGSISDLARLANGQVVELIHLQTEGAARYGVPRPGYYVLEVFTHRIVDARLGDAPDLVTSRLAIDGRGVAWTSSHRFGEGFISVPPVLIGVPNWWQVTGAAAGGAYVTFGIGIRGCPSWCDPAVKTLGEGTYRVRLDADGAIRDLREGAHADDLLVESAGPSPELWTTRAVVMGRNYALALGLEDAQKMIASSGHVAPSALARATAGVWVGGGFTGQLRANGTTLDAGATQGRPLLLRVPSRAALAAFGN